MSAGLLDFRPRRALCLRGVHRFRVIAFDSDDVSIIQMPGEVPGAVPRDAAIFARCADCDGVGLSTHERTRREALWAAYDSAAWRVFARLDGKVEVEVLAPLDLARASRLAIVLSTLAKPC